MRNLPENVILVISWFVEDIIRCRERSGSIRIFVFIEICCGSFEIFGRHGRIGKRCGRRQGRSFFRYCCWLNSMIICIILIIMHVAVCLSPSLSLHQPCVVLYMVGGRHMSDSFLLWRVSGATMMLTFHLNNQAIQMVMSKFLKESEQC